MDPANDGTTVPAAGATTPATTTEPTTTATPATEEVANPSKQDWAQFKKDQRELVNGIKALVDEVKAAKGGRTADPAKPATTASATTTATADASGDRIANLERKAELNGVYADLGIKAGPQRDFIENATKGMPAESVRAFVESYLKTIPAPTTATASAAAITNPVTPPVATGAASVAAKPDPGDLASMDPEVLKSLPLEERRKRYEEYRSRGPNSNPYAGARSRQLVRTGGK